MAQLKLWRVVDPPTSAPDRSSAASPVNAMGMTVDMANPQDKAKVKDGEPRGKDA